LSLFYHVFVLAFDNVQVPKFIEEALKDSGWRRAVSEEINTLNKNNT
jgi:hypothetical protein